MRILMVVLFGSLLAGIPVPASAQGNSQGRGRSGQGAQAAQTGKSNEGPGISVGLAFGDVEIRIIREWFSKSDNLKGLPPGLAKKETLPPGLAQQLRKNGTLPPGLQKKVQPLPRDLEARLPRLPDGRRRIVISASVILMDEKTNKIFDILEKVF